MQMSQLHCFSNSKLLAKTIQGFSSCKSSWILIGSLSMNHNKTINNNLSYECVTHPWNIHIYICISQWFVSEEKSVRSLLGVALALIQTSFVHGRNLRIERDLSLLCVALSALRRSFSSSISSFGYVLILVYKSISVWAFHRTAGNCFSAANITFSLKQKSISLFGFSLISLASAGFLFSVLRARPFLISSQM